MTLAMHSWTCQPVPMTKLAAWCLILFSQSADSDTTPNRSKIFFKVESSIFKTPAHPSWGQILEPLEYLNPQGKTTENLQGLSMMLPRWVRIQEFKVSGLQEAQANIAAVWWAGCHVWCGCWVRPAGAARSSLSLQIEWGRQGFILWFRGCYYNWNWTYGSWYVWFTYLRKYWIVQQFSICLSKPVSVFVTFYWFPKYTLTTCKKRTWTDILGKLNLSSIPWHGV